jgi:hypothetical protein
VLPALSSPAAPRKRRVNSPVEGSVAYEVEGEPVVVLTPGDALDGDVTFIAHFLLSAGQHRKSTLPPADHGRLSPGMTSSYR